MAKAADTRPTDAGPASLGKGLRVVGRVHGEGDLHIEAEIEGDVTITGHLAIDQAARITGTVEADSVVVAGALQGDAKARGSVAIAATGSVRGDITAQELSLEEGGGLEGSVFAQFDLPEPLA